MDVIVKAFYNKVTKEVNNFKIHYARCVIDKDVIDSYKRNSVVKFIFFNKDYADLTFDTSINEIHKLKSKYRGNTYIRLPLHIIQNEEDEYPTGFEIIKDEEALADGYVMISKHDIRSNYDKLKYANANERVNFGIQTCEKAVEEYNTLLRAEVFGVKIFDNENRLIFDKIVNNTDEISKVIGKEFHFDGESSRPSENQYEMI